jgi:hypothetical protein
MSLPPRFANHGDVASEAAEDQRLRRVRPAVRRGLSRIEAATYIGISPSKFDELRKANRIAPPKVLDGRLIFTVERLDEFLDALPDENREGSEDWTVAV